MVTTDNFKFNELFFYLLGFGLRSKLAGEGAARRAYLLSFQVLLLIAEIQTELQPILTIFGFKKCEQK
jgi:hypothetical protein